MMDAVHRYEGTVNQVLGDGIMASSARRLPMRPCHPGLLRRLAMQVAMQDYTEEVRCAHGLELRIRVGLNSGKWWSGDRQRPAHGLLAVGQTTHLAAPWSSWPAREHPADGGDPQAG